MTDASPGDHRSFYVLIHMKQKSYTDKPMSFDGYTESWLAPAPTMERQLEVRNALFAHTRNRLLRFTSNRSLREHIIRLDADSFSCHLKNRESRDLNPFAVTTGGTDLTDRLEAEAQEEGHSYYVSMYLSKDVDPLRNDVIRRIQTLYLPIENDFAAETLNTFAPEAMRHDAASMLTHRYIRSDISQESDMETTETETPPLWREGGDTAWLHYELLKLRQVYEEISGGTLKQRSEFPTES